MSEWHTLDTAENRMDQCTPQDVEDLVEVMSDVRDLLNEVAPIIRDVGFLVEGHIRSMRKTRNMTTATSGSSRTTETTRLLAQMSQDQEMQIQPKTASPQQQESPSRQQ